MLFRVASLGILTFLTLAPAARADAPIVNVRIPAGLTAGFPGTSVAANGNLYVTVPEVRATNANSSQYMPYEPRDFHLLVHDHVYYPVVRPGLSSLDLSNGGTVRPNGTLVVTVTFEVPPGVTNADFEFIPHWVDNNGGSVNFCCLYL